MDTFDGERVGGGKRRQFFPVLPIDDEDDDDDYGTTGEGADENNPILSNLHPRDKLNFLEEPPKQGVAPSKASTVAVFKPPASPPSCSSMLKSNESSYTPSEGECAARLVQIRREIRKARRMMGSTRNASVRAACGRRASRLATERRFHQIAMERHKLRSMMEASSVPFVRRACGERSGALLREMRALRLADVDDEDTDGEGVDARNAPEGAPACDAASCADARAGGSDDRDEDGQWYDRILRYLGEVPLREEMANARECLASGQFNEESTHHRESGPSKQRQHGGQVRFAEGQCSGQRRSDGHHNGHRGAACAPLSPRSDNAIVRDDSQTQTQTQDRRRTPVGRHPVAVATATKSRATWFGV